MRCLAVHPEFRGLRKFTFITELTKTLIHSEKGKPLTVGSNYQCVFSKLGIGKCTCYSIAVPAPAALSGMIQQNTGRPKK